MIDLDSTPPCPLCGGQLAEYEVPWERPAPEAPEVLPELPPEDEPPEVEEHGPEWWGYYSCPACSWELPDQEQRLTYWTASWTRALAAEVEAAAERERAAIVAWLRGRAPGAYGPVGDAEAPGGLDCDLDREGTAAGVERGEHHHGR